MKRFVLTLLLFVSILTLKAEVPSMSFRLNDGSEKTIPVEGLEINFDNNNNLVAVSGSSTLSIPLSQLMSMSFVNSTNGVENLDADMQSTVTAYRADGIMAGTFASLQEAEATLSPGIYIVKQANGKTIKFAVRK